jgi:hypothetical protein
LRIWKMFRPKLGIELQTIALLIYPFQDLRTIMSLWRKVLES